jgi:hypothetical protein
MATAHRRNYSRTAATTSCVRVREVAEGRQGNEVKAAPRRSVTQDMNSDCRRSAIPRASSSSRIMSTLWRRSIQGEVALRKHDFISFLRPLYRSNGAHRMVSLGGPYSTRYSAKLAAFSTFNRVSQGAPSAKITSWSSSLIWKNSNSSSSRVMCNRGAVD